MIPLFREVFTMLSFSTLVRRAAALTTAATMVALAACSSDKAGSLPAAVLPANPAIPAQYRGAAFVFNVSATKKTVSVTAPTATIRNPIAAASLNLNAGPNYSLLGADVIDLSTSNFQASAVGAVLPGKVRITFDVTINNRLSGIRLITPTFPTPPAGVTGVQAFPFEISVTTTAGSVGQGSTTNEIVVTSPRFGAVVPSTNWDGNSHNFFNDAGCPSTATDCFRYESFGQIEPSSSSSTQQVGFDIEPTVGDFRVKVLLAADLENGTPPAPGSVSGTVTTPAGVSLAGATVNVSGGFSGTVGAGGAYTVASVTTGTKTVSVTNLPSYCVAPASQSVTVSSAAASTANFTVACTIPTGSIAGTVTSSLGGGIANVSITATPTGGSATAAVTTAATTGAFSITTPALVSGGVLTLTNVPSNCTNPGPTAYTGLTTTGLSGISIVLTCTPPPPEYPVSLTWGAITTGGPTGRQVELTVSWAAQTQQVVGLAGAIGVGANLAYASRTFTSSFDFGAANFTGSGTAGSSLSFAYGAVSPAFETGTFDVIKFKFNIAAGFSGSITPTLTLSEATRQGATPTNILSSTPVSTLPTLVIP
ncbi:MAG: carboxypeptidase-like regulatory domain-containing protein [Gemmatimonadota bacterium]|nr:carboxypeptidase-like regulatory domain-containing protein [Gemmatimonadota bacterium]